MNEGRAAQGDLFEWLLGLALVVSVVVRALQVRRMLRDQRRMKNALQGASGAFGEFLQHQFRDWDLSHSESDVALFAIKGSSIAEIARMRGTKDGTIKAQLNAIYRKARVTGRQQLISFPIDEMVEGITHAP
jgi:DNA-binding CsgD family transcriptional regulator